MKKLTAKQTREALKICRDLTLIGVRLNDIGLPDTSRSLGSGALNTIGYELAWKGDRSVLRTAAKSKKKRNP